MPDALAFDPERDAQAREFRLGNITQCVAARSGLSPETLVLRGDQLTPGQLADRFSKPLSSAGGRTPPARHRGIGRGEATARVQ